MLSFRTLAIVIEFTLRFPSILAIPGEYPHAIVTTTLRIHRATTSPVLRIDVSLSYWFRLSFEFCIVGISEVLVTRAKISSLRAIDPSGALSPPGSRRAIDRFFVLALLSFGALFLSRYYYAIDGSR